MISSLNINNFLCRSSSIKSLHRRLNVMGVHHKCRNTNYGSAKNIVRTIVPDELVNWAQKWPEYNPPLYTAKETLGKPWADQDIEDPSFTPTWNALDVNTNVNRKSYNGEYNVVNGYPINPAGRTGLRGRGILGKWGPNHAADPIVTRWKRDSCNQRVLNPVSQKVILQFVSIKRRDNKQWAFPGGMVDPGEAVSQTLKREFLEETMNSLEMNPNVRKLAETSLNEFFNQGRDIYKGYVDDPRNTDNAWMETDAKHFHDEDGHLMENINFNAGDDAIGVRWLDVSQELELYASHGTMLKSVAENMNAHW